MKNKTDEILSRNSHRSDMWSCGVIMFLLLGGDLPFSGRSQKELFRNIVTGQYEFEGDGWTHVSEQARDLVRAMLVTDPSRRLSSREAMASPWMRQRGNALARNNLRYASKRLGGFNVRMKLRASMITVRSTVSMRNSLHNLRGEGSASSSKRPSFLDLPVECIEDEDEDEEED